MKFAGHAGLKNGRRKKTGRQAGDGLFEGLDKGPSSTILYRTIRTLRIVANRLQQLDKRMRRERLTVKDSTRRGEER